MSDLPKESPIKPAKGGCSASHGGKTRERRRRSTPESSPPHQPNEEPAISGLGVEPTLDHCTQSRAAVDADAQSARAAATVLATGDPLIRAELEARVLAGEAAAAIAAKLRLELSVVEEYERLHFPARPLLKHRSVIIHEYCRIPYSGDFDPKDVSTMWRHVAYSLGLEALEELLRGVSRSELRRRGLWAYFGPRSRLSPEAKFSIAAKILPTPETPRDLKLFMLLTSLLEPASTVAWPSDGRWPM